MFSPVLCQEVLERGREMGSDAVYGIACYYFAETYWRQRDEDRTMYYLTESTKCFLTQGLYSLLGLFAKAFIIDGVIENIGKSKYITIITSTPQPVGSYIIDVMKRDYTAYKAVGGYTGNDKTILITVCKRGEALRLKSKVKQLDAQSFVIITDANEILGKGFRQS